MGNWWPKLPLPVLSGRARPLFQDLCREYGPGTGKAVNFYNGGDAMPIYDRLLEQEASKEDSKLRSRAEPSGS